MVYIIIIVELRRCVLETVDFHFLVFKALCYYLWYYSDVENWQYVIFLSPKNSSGGEDRSVVCPSDATAAAILQCNGGDEFVQERNGLLLYRKH
jgi:hypothetical protein